MSEAILCEPAGAVGESFAACESFGSLEEARAAVPEVLGRCVCQQMLEFPERKDRKSGYVTVSRDPRKAEAVGAIALKIIMSGSGWVPESELVYSDWPEKQRKMKAALADLVRIGALRRGEKTPRGYSYTLGNNWKRFTEETNDRSANCR